jgi:uncharacterized phage protein (TIGR01671 family)
MREIKFRVWHKNEKRWLDPWAEEDPMLSLKDCGEGCEVFLYERDSGDWSNKNCLMKDIVIQQYTGLKDKNGVEIYEGDLLLSAFCRDEENPVEVSWGDKNNGWNVNHKKGQEGPLLKIHQQSYEVVGNIFEGVDK